MVEIFHNFSQVPTPRYIPEFGYISKAYPVILKELCVVTIFPMDRQMETRQCNEWQYQAAMCVARVKLVLFLHVHVHIIFLIGWKNIPGLCPVVNQEWSAGCVSGMHLRARDTTPSYSALPSPRGRMSSENTKKQRLMFWHGAANSWNEQVYINNFFSFITNTW